MFPLLNVSKSQLVPKTAPPETSLLGSKSLAHCAIDRYQKSLGISNCTKSSNPQEWHVNDLFNSTPCNATQPLSGKPIHGTGGVDPKCTALPPRADPIMEHQLRLSMCTGPGIVVSGSAMAACHRLRVSSVHNA